MLGMDNGVTGSPHGAGSVIGAATLDVLEISVFWRDEVVAKVRRFRGRFFGGSFCRLLFPVDGGVVAVVTVSGVAVRLLLLLAVASSLESTSTNTSSSSPSCSTDDGVSLYPRPLSPPLDVRPFCSDSDSHHLVYPRFSAGAGD